MVLAIPLNVQLASAYCVIRYKSSDYCRTFYKRFEAQLPLSTLSASTLVNTFMCVCVCVCVCAAL
jgi:hypothetical protein